MTAVVAAGAARGESAVVARASGAGAGAETRRGVASRRRGDASRRGVAARRRGKARRHGVRGPGRGTALALESNA